jgi:hypothetical protein
MKLIRSFFRRPLADRALVAQAIAVHLGAAALLRIGGLRRAMAWSDPPPARCARRAAAEVRRSDAPGRDVEARVGWAVRTATCLVPLGRTCLTEALAAQFLLRRCGHGAALRFGVARAPDRAAGEKVAETLTAHAWLESAGRIIIGGETAAEYQPLAAQRETA